MLLTRRSALATTAFAFTSARAWGQTIQPDAAEFEPGAGPAETDGPRPGDRWTYEVKDEITGEMKWLTTETITEITDKEIVIRRTFSHKAGQTLIVYDHDWNLIDSPDWKFTPNDKMGIVKPLKPGKEWRANCRAKNTATEAILQTKVQAKIVGEESVTTKAGTYDVFKIAYALSHTNPAAPSRALNGLIDLYYAPSINHWVKRRYRSLVDGRLQEDSTLELTAYKRKNADAG